MTLAIDDALRGASQPYTPATTTRTLDLTTADATITLVEGVYDLHHNAAVTVYVRLAATSADLPPATAAAEVDGFPIPAGAVATLAIPAGGVLHARVASSTATLSIVRKVLA